MDKRQGGRAKPQHSPCRTSCLLDHWVDPVVCVDEAGRIVFANRQFVSWFGGIDQLSDLLARLESRTAARLLQLVQNKSRKSVPFFEAGENPRGSAARFDLDFMPLAGRKEYRYLLHFYDSSRNLSLFRQNLEMEKYQSLVTLTAGITHNFNNILAGIKGYAGLIRKWTETTDSPLASYAFGIERLAERGAEVNRKLLSFTGKEHSFSAPVEVNALLHEVVEKISPLATKRGVGIEVKLLGRRMYFMGDRFQLLDAFGNILLNAVESYVQPGGTVSIQVTLRRRKIEDPGIVRMGEACRAVQVVVADSGRGMSREETTHAFEPFFTTKQTDEGLGLGLPITLGIVQGHGGEIRLESRMGKGTTVKVSLPVYDLPMVEPAATVSKPGREARKGRPTGVLVVDDEPDILRIIEKLLGDLGLRVMTAKSGEEAQTVLIQAGHEIRLVILDMVLEDMSGIEVFQRIRRLMPNLPVLFVSGQDLPFQNRELLSQGAAGFLGKPFNLADLQKKVMQILQFDTEASPGSNLLV
jgi:signal transduction histidine kinase/CheY-like chemotaxis protein